MRFIFAILFASNAFAGSPQSLGPCSFEGISDAQCKEMRVKGASPMLQIWDGHQKKLFEYPGQWAGIEWAAPLTRHIFLTVWASGSAYVAVPIQFLDGKFKVLFEVSGKSFPEIIYGQDQSVSILMSDGKFADGGKWVNTRTHLMKISATGEVTKKESSFAERLKGL